MKHMKWKNICLIIFAVAFSTALFANESFDDSMLIAQQSKKSKKSNRNMNRDPNTWKPYFQNTKATEPISSFYQQTAGVGFLYFSGIRGNLNGNAGSIGAFNIAPKSNTKLQGKIGYNRTPVSEFIIGRDLWFWFKIALSYTHQGGVWVATAPQTQAALANGVSPILQSGLQLDAALFRVYFMSPWTMVWKNTYYEPYLSAGIGPGWQTWTPITLPNFFNPLRMKVSANCVFTIDLGVKFRRAMPTYVMSFTAGCKFTDWGQARSMGAIQNQGGAFGGSLSNPLRIKTVFQFAPYLGVQFNF